MVEAPPSRRSLTVAATGTPSGVVGRGRRAAEAVVRGLGSRVFAVVVVLWFAAQAAIIAAASSKVIYDESYHLAAVEAFSRRWTPFITQVAADGPLGDAERYGSYLYHYLLSFPWRVTELVGLNDGRQLLVLRLVSVTMVSLGLLAWRWLFRELGASRALANVCMAVVAATPLIVFLAAFVNYDNLIFLITPLFLRSVVRLYKADQFAPREWALVLLWAGLGAVTKYTFLPFLPIAGIAVLVRQISVRGQTPPGSLRAFLSGDGERRRRVANIALLLGAVLAVALVVERYVGNVLLYRSIMPDCLDVHPLSICSMHAPWARNYELDAAFPDAAPSVLGGLAYLTAHWIPLMLKNSTWYGVVFEDSIVQSRGPHITGLILYVGIAAVLVAIFVSLGVLRRHRGALLLLSTCMLYIVVLFVQNYSDFRTLGIPLAVSGRYLLVVLPVFVVLAGLGVTKIFTLTSARSGTAMKLFSVGCIALLGTQGGGMSSYLWSIDDTWVSHPEGRPAKLVLDLSSFAQDTIIPNEWVKDPRQVE